MRVFEGKTRRPLDLLAVGTGCVAACTSFGNRSDVEVWDTATGTLRHTHPVAERVGALAFTPDGRFLLVGELQAIAVLEVATWGRRPGPALRLGHPVFALSADGSRLLTATAWNQAGMAACWDMAEGPQFREVWADGPHELFWFDAPAMSADGRRVALVGRGTYGDRNWQAIHVGPADHKTPTFEIRQDAADVVCQLAFTADGSKLLARSRGRTVPVFDTHTGEAAGELRHPGRPFVTGMAVHPGGRAIATCRNDGTVRLWDPATLREVRALDWKLGKLVSVAFSPDGSLGAAGTEDGRVIVWDVDA